MLVEVGTSLVTVDGTVIEVLYPDSCLVVLGTSVEILPVKPAAVLLVGAGTDGLAVLCQVLLGGVLLG